MKYILTNENDEIFNMSETKGFQENGNYLMNEGLPGEVAIPHQLVKGVFVVEKIPAEVCEVKWCYTEENGFYINENYVEPEEPVDTQELLQKIALLEKQNKDLDEQITEIQLLIVEGGI